MLNIDARISWSIKKPLVDITNESYKELFNPDPAYYSKSQEFGKKICEEKHWGLLYPSIRNFNGLCMAIFRPPALTIPCQGCHLRYIWDGNEFLKFIKKVNLHMGKMLGLKLGRNRGQRSIALMQNGTAIKITALKKNYDNGFKALNGINLEINRGEIFALLGPNGAGKPHSSILYAALCDPATEQLPSAVTITSNIVKLVLLLV